MKRILVAGLAGLACSCALFGQNETDALRYSQTGFGGTARFSGMAGAFGAVGADVSSFNINPAGLGLYHKSELVFTPSFFSQNVNSTYNGTQSLDSRYNFRFDNFGVVFAGKTSNESETGWQNASMGITYNRTTTFEANLNMKGVSSTSMLDSWARSAHGTGPSQLDPFNEGLAWNAWLLNTVPGDTTKYTDVIPDNDPLNQDKAINMRGGMGEWLFDVAGNYSNKLYIGGAISVTTLRYEENSDYTEQEVVDSTSHFNYLKFTQLLTTQGKGFAFKAGVIYRPMDMVRVGFSFQSPTILRLSDAWQSSMYSVLTDSIYNVASPEGNFNYTIRTPMRATASAALIFGKSGMVSVDYEIVDYSSAIIKSTQYSFANENAAIKDKYTMANNVRIGGEYRLLPLVLRAGVGYYGSPYKPSINNNAAKLYFTGGVGYRDPDDQFYVDLAAITSHEISNYYFYDQSLVNPVKNAWNSLDVVLSIGFRY
ncbi:MAG TPA: outer membrane protein transport protein [Bacteroidia bacterium]|nr:outer membrane protein transport protein [Bacteroidia bacterium]